MKRGFTLIELLLVIGLMSVVLTLSAVNYSHVFANMELRTSVNDMVSLMRYAKTRAVSQHVIVRLNFKDNFKRYHMQQAMAKDGEVESEFVNIAHRLGREVVLPRSIKITAEQDYINFYPDGSIDRTRILFTSKKRNMIVSTMEQRGYVFIIEE